MRALLDEDFKMRIATAAALLIIAMNPALACNDTLFAIDDWQASASKDGRSMRTEVSVDLRYEGERGYRMIQAGVLFSDVLGNALVTVPIGRDVSRSPGDAFSDRGVFLSRESRITAINPDDVTAKTCVWSVVYEDGSLETFR